MTDVQTGTTIGHIAQTCFADHPPVFIRDEDGHFEGTPNRCLPPVVDHIVHLLAASSLSADYEDKMSLPVACCLHQKRKTRCAVAIESLV